MNANEKIIEATLDAMREMSVEDLREEQRNIHRYVEDAVATTLELLEFVILEKLARTIN